jgi:hypothetical protein
MEIAVVFDCTVLLQGSEFSLKAHLHPGGEIRKLSSFDFRFTLPTLAATNTNFACAHRHVPIGVVVLLFEPFGVQVDIVAPALSFSADKTLVIAAAEIAVIVIRVSVFMLCCVVVLCCSVTNSFPFRAFWDETELACRLEQRPGILRCLMARK